MVKPQTVSDEASDEALAIQSLDNDLRFPIVESARKQLDKQSVEYILKSGLAGGLAGCAVSIYILRSGGTRSDALLSRRKQ